MAAERPLDPVHAPRPGAEHERTLFAYEAVRDRRLVTRLFVIDGDGRAVRVAAEIHPAHAPESSEPQWRFYDFPTLRSAQHFAEEALLALEYLGCTVTETRAQMNQAARETTAAKAFVA
jgi:hypothetical protein